MMTPKDLLDTMLGYLGFVVDIEETTNEGGNPTLQIYTEESQRQGRRKSYRRLRALPVDARRSDRATGARFGRAGAHHGAFTSA
jgi:hypothetical protein